MEVKKGSIVILDLDKQGIGGNVGSEQSGQRPGVVIQNNIGNRFSPTIIVGLCTTQWNKNNMPTHVIYEPRKGGFVKKTTVCLEQQRTVDKQRIVEVVGLLTEEEMLKIEMADLIAKGMNPKVFGMYGLYLEEQEQKRKEREQRRKTS